MVPAARRGARDGRRAAGAWCRTRSHRSACSDRRRGRSSPRSRRRGSRARPSPCSRCRCGSARSRSSWRRPGAGWRTPTPRSSSSTPNSRPSCPTGCRPRASTQLNGDARRFVAPTVDPDALAILQFTSGSTADPKGVMLPHRCVTANIDAIRRGAAFDDDRDRVASWLPLYHDMGLIGLLGVPDDHRQPTSCSPDRRTSSPHRSRWLDWMSTFGCTVTGGPNFSYALAARALRRAGDLDLRPWRLALNGAEPIDPDAVDEFLAAGAPYGLDAGAAFCVYGMAEATLAITFPEPGAGMTVDAVDRRVLETDRYAAPVDGPPRRRPAPAATRARPRRPRAARGRPRHRCGPSRPRGRRGGAARGVDHAGLLPQPRRHRGRASATGGCAPATSATSSTASS